MVTRVYALTAEDIHGEAVPKDSLRNTFNFCVPGLERNLANN